MNPPENIARLPPETWNVPAIEEDAAAANPPEASIVKMLEEAEVVMRSGSPVAPVWSFRVRRVEAVVVAPMVTIERTSGVVVPMPTIGVDDEKNVLPAPSTKKNSAPSLRWRLKS